MEYEVIGEDLWSGTPTNTILNKQSNGYGVFCQCKDCKDWYDRFDPCMVKIFNPRNNG